MSNPNIVVIGGAVVDLVFQISEFPPWNEAVQAKDFRQVPGGKGLNQAIAAENLGGAVSMISAVGDDRFGDQIIDNLDKNSISRENVKRVEDGQTAVTNVLVNIETSRTIYLGYKSVTNTDHVVDAVRRAEDTIKEADAILMTFEVPLEAIETALDIAEQVPESPQFILNPAPPLPRHEIDFGLLNRMEIMVPNRWEAERLVQTTDVSASKLARRVKRLGPSTACVTDPEHGCVVITSSSEPDWDGPKEFQPLGEVSKDTTGANTAFCGTLGVSMARGDSLKPSIIRANAAAACVIEKEAAAPSMPSEDDVTDKLDGRREYLEEIGVARDFNIGRS